jgi:hypothetical protein
LEDPNATGFFESLVRDEDGSSALASPAFMEFLVVLGPVVCVRPTTGVDAVPVAFLCTAFLLEGEPNDRLTTLNNYPLSSFQKNRTKPGLLLFKRLSF